MTGMNLSSSIPDKKPPTSGVFTSTMVVVLVFSLLLIVWGGMQWYLKVQNDTLAVKKALYEAESVKLKGSSVDRVASFTTRMNLSKDRVATNTADTEKLLTQIEGLVIPPVRLTKYIFDAKGSSVAIQGETDNFKYVAQQLLALKGEALFSGIRVEKLGKDDKGVITFSLKAEFLNQ